MSLVLFTWTLLLDNQKLTLQSNVKDSDNDFNNYNHQNHCYHHDH